MQTEPDFEQRVYNTRGGENNSHSEAIYEKQSKRLCRNSRIILECLISGQVLNGIKCAQGITTAKGEHAIMIEFRKRKQEIIKAGINVMESVGENGVKDIWLDAEGKEKAIQLLNGK